MTDSRSIIESFREVVIQIATPYSTGTGFFLKGPDLIVTNEHVVRGNREVVIDGQSFDKQLVKVLFSDSKYDLAFLHSPTEHKMPEVPLAREEEDKLAEGETVLAVGHPFGLRFSATQGIVSNLMHQQNQIQYIQHDAALNPGNSGGPLINLKGQVVGVNTFIIRDGNSIGFSLPVKYLQAAMEAYREHEGKGSKVAVRCHSCSNLVFEDNIAEGDFCPNCGAKIILPSQVDKYEPVGVKRTIEEILGALNFNVDLSRRGPNHWELNRGSAKINISYHEKTGLIVGDAYLVTLPLENIEKIYNFLLRENYQIENLTFSVKGNDIILSLLIYDRYLNAETGNKLFDHLIKSADKYDNLLVDEYGAQLKIQD